MTRRRRRMIMMIMTVMMLMMIHSFKWIPNIYELRQSGKSEEEFEWPPWIRE